MMSYRLDILNQGTIGLEIFLCVGTFFFILTNGMLLQIVGKNQGDC